MLLNVNVVDIRSKKEEKEEEEEEEEKEEGESENDRLPTVPKSLLALSLTEWSFFIGILTAVSYLNVEENNWNYSYSFYRMK